MPQNSEPYSYSGHSPHRLFKNSSTGSQELTAAAYHKGILGPGHSIYMTEPQDMMTSDSKIEKPGPRDLITGVPGLDSWGPSIHTCRMA